MNINHYNGCQLSMYEIYSEQCSDGLYTKRDEFKAILDERESMDTEAFYEKWNLDDDHIEDFMRDIREEYEVLNDILVGRENYCED